MYGYVLSGIENREIYKMRSLNLPFCLFKMYNLFANKILILSISEKCCPPRAIFWLKSRTLTNGYTSVSFDWFWLCATLQHWKSIITCWEMKRHFLENSEEKRTAARNFEKIFSPKNIISNNIRVKTLKFFLYFILFPYTDSTSVYFSPYVAPSEKRPNALKL